MFCPWSLSLGPILGSVLGTDCSFVAELNEQVSAVHHQDVRVPFSALVSRRLWAPLLDSPVNCS